MKKSQSNLVIQRFVSAAGKNQYLLTSAGEAAIYTGSGDLTVMGNEGWIQCLRSA
jgi:hypothetical protein